MIRQPWSRVAHCATAAVGVLALVGGIAVSTGSADAMTAGVGGTSLQLGASQRLPHSSATTGLASAEASNGAVAVAVPVTGTRDDIELARAGHAPRVLLTVPHGTVALAFDHSDLFIAGPRAISSVDRDTGTVVRTWQIRTSSAVEVGGAVMTYGDGRLWVLGKRGDARKVFEIGPGAAAVTSVGTGRNVFSIAAGSGGVYFVRSGGHTLVRVSAGGHRSTAPTRETVSETESGPDALQAVVVDGQDLIVAHDYGQGLDAGIVRYNARTLAHLGVAGTSVALTAVVPTTDGDLIALRGPGQGGCSANDPCVARISTTTAKTSDKVHLGGRILSMLLGPKPAIVVARGHHADLLRLR